MGPMLHLFIFVADLCYLIFPNFLAYFTIFLSLENETGANFWTQLRGTWRLSLNMPANQRVTSSQSDLSFTAPKNAHNPQSLLHIRAPILANRGPQKRPQPTKAAYYRATSG